MADFVTVKITGLAELEKELLSLPEKMAKPALRTASRRAAQILQRQARSMAPVRTGRLREGIIIASKVKGDGVRGATITTAIGLRVKPKDKSAFYGKFIEFGWKGAIKRPFLAPSFESLKNRMLDLFQIELASAIRKIKVKLSQV